MSESAIRFTGERISDSLYRERIRDSLYKERFSESLYMGLRTAYQSAGIVSIIGGSGDGYVLAQVNVLNSIKEFYPIFHRALESFSS